ncbi:MAG: histidine kinase [Lachnospiraceae bacterium]|nr:histidine kinase [Lachnospiraceae bacterium]
MRKKRKENFVSRVLNDLSIRKKLVIFYVVCIIFPLFFMNGLFVRSLINGERKGQDKDMERVAERVEEGIRKLVSEAETGSNKVYLNKRLCDFLEVEYASELDYFTERYQLFTTTFFEEGFASPNSSMVMYADNPTIVNGGHFWKLDKSEVWYERLKESGSDAVLCFYFSGRRDSFLSNFRQVSLVRKLNYFSKRTREKVVRVDLQYSAFLDLLANVGMDDLPVYVCSEGRVLFSNRKNVSYYSDFDERSSEINPAYQQDFELYGMKFQIMVQHSSESFVLTTIQKNQQVIFLLLSLSLIVPFVLLFLINRSFTGRLWELSRAFRSSEKEGELTEVEHVRGKDEIGYLMESYNGLVRQNNHLIKTIYEDRLHKQEMELGRKNAELLALRMQVNPHFLFNMLESIRMSSLLNRESRTAEMIEKLAMLERQAVDWGSDFETVRNEMGFVENYLSLQRFRFGDRFFYSLNVDEDCMELRIPKMTILTFVENACVHGTDQKLTETRVFVTITRKEEWVEIEIEDTSGGMSEEKVVSIREQMENCTIDMLRESKHTGMINACLRLKMMSNNRVKFELESDEGIGTYLLIRLPVEEML